MRDRDLVVLRIRNTENVQYKRVGASFRRRDKLKPNVGWGVLGKVVLSNSRPEWPTRSTFGPCQDDGNDRKKTKER